MSRTISVLLVSTSNSVFDLLTKSYKSREIKIIRVTSDLALYYTLENIQEYDAIFLDLESFEEANEEIIRQLKYKLPLVPIIALYHVQHIDKAIKALKIGVYDSLITPFTSEDVVHALDRIFNQSHNGHSDKGSNGTLGEDFDNRRIVANSKSMQRALLTVSAAAHTNAPVIFTGESGSGKQFLARKIHQLSTRRHFPFTRVHCSNRETSGLEQELFGKIRNEFPWKSHLVSGVLEQANHGTIFLDEIAGISRSIQVKMRDFLQNGEFEITGSDTCVTTDVRVIAATNKNLDKEIQLSKIRKDFYFKINILSIKVPSLRERLEDLQELAYIFLEKFARAYKKSVGEIHPDAMEKLMQYSWPGNVRELQNYLERAVLFCKSDMIQVIDLPETLLKKSSERFIRLRLSSPLINNVEEALIAQVLNETKGNVSKTANLLGISRGTLYSKIRKYGLETETKSKILRYSISN